MKNPKTIIGQRIAIFIIEDFDDIENSAVFKIVGTFNWDNDEIVIEDVDWGAPFRLPGELMEIVSEADENTKEITPEAELAIVIPKDYYPFKF